MDFSAQGYIKLWQDAEDGSAHYPPHSVYQYVTSQYPQMGKSNAALYQTFRVLEVVHGWKLDLDNVVWDVPTFLERREAIHRWDHIIPDEMQRNAGNRTWQTEDNAIVGEEMETGSFEHKHVIMTIPSKHRLDNLIADVCTSQIVIDRTDVHNQLTYSTVYSLGRGQLDRTAQERTPKLGTMTLGKLPNEFWAEYLRRKTEYFQKKRAINLAKARAIQTEATQTRVPITADEIEALIFSNEKRSVGKDGSFSLSRVRTFLKDEGYGQVPYWKVQEGTAQANEHRKLKQEAETAENQG